MSLGPSIPPRAGLRQQRDRRLVSACRDSSLSSARTSLTFFFFFSFPFLKSGGKPLPLSKRGRASAGTCDQPPPGFSRPGCDWRVPRHLRRLRSAGPGGGEAPSRSRFFSSGIAQAGAGGNVNPGAGKRGRSAPSSEGNGSDAKSLRCLKKKTTNKQNPKKQKPTTNREEEMFSEEANLFNRSC